MLPLGQAWVIKSRWVCPVSTVNCSPQSPIIQRHSLSICFISIFVLITTSGHGGNQQPSLRRQVPLEPSTFLLLREHPYPKDGVLPWSCVWHNSRGSHSHGLPWEWCPLELCHVVTLPSCRLPQLQLTFILHDSAQVFSLNSSLASLLGGNNNKVIVTTITSIFCALYTCEALH